MFKQVFKKINRRLIIQERYLTLGEIQLVQSIFSDQIKHLNHIRIIAHRAILKNYALSPNGNIYFHIDNFEHDFSMTDVVTQSWFIHEMVHVWQIQQGIHVIRKALFNRRYQYVLKTDRLFLNYGVEQQAQMVQDYFLRKHRGQSCTEFEDCIPFLKIKDGT